MRDRKERFRTGKNTANIIPLWPPAGFCEQQEPANIINLFYQEDDHMKNKRLLALMTAALTGISAAAIPGAIPAAPSGPAACITAHAANGENPGTLHDCKTYIGGYEIRYEYYENSDEVTIYKIDGGPHGSGPLVIPQKLANRNVTKIDGRAAFRKCIQSIKLPDTVREIRGYAFAGCSATKIELSSALTTIEAYAFTCSKIQEIVIPEGVTYINGSTFSDCKDLKTVSMAGATTIEQGAFDGCSSLTSITIREDCVPKGCDCSCLFKDSPDIDTINGHTIISEATDENGRTYPVLDPQVRGIVQKFFWNCEGTNFVSDYCDRLCRYVVSTETDPWMNDALKARQLHDWLIQHCTPNKVAPKRTNDMLYSAFFLSYGTSENGVGKAVCSSYAKAYTMLLSAAGIESYVINDVQYPGYAWNMVKIGTGSTAQYYEVDTYREDEKNAHYGYFLKSDSEMYALHKSYSFNTLLACAYEHELLNMYTEDYETLAAQCGSSYPDVNGDGILDYDFDLDGAALQGSDWNEYNGMMQFCFGLNSMEYINTRMSEVFDHLRQSHMNYYDYMTAAAPSSVTVHAGEAVQLKVTLFGDDLLYQWWARPRGSYSVWQYGGSNTNTLNLTASSHMNNLEYCCWIGNKNCFSLYIYPVTVTVI